MQGIADLLSRLEKVRFTGELTVHITAGVPDAATLKHYLAHSEFMEPLPIVENAPGPTCQKGGCEHGPCVGCK